MPVYVIDTLKPKNGLDFPVVEAIDVAVEGYASLADAVSHFATDTAIAALTAALDDKADKTITDSLQAQIDQIAQAAGTGSADTEVAQARVNSSGVTFNTLKDRLDNTEAEQAKINEEIAKDFGYTVSKDVPYTTNEVPKDDGTFFVDTDATQHWFGSGYVELEPDVKFIKYCGINFNNGSIKITPLAFYDSSHTFISCVPVISQTQPVEGTINVPENAKYFVQSKYYAAGSERSSNNYTEYGFGKNYDLDQISQNANDAVDTINTDIFGASDKPAGISNNSASNTEIIWFQYSEPLRGNQIRFKAKTGTINFYKVSYVEGASSATYELITSVTNTALEDGKVKAVNIDVETSENEYIGVNGAFCFAVGEIATGYYTRNITIATGVISTIATQYLDFTVENTNALDVKLNDNIEKCNQLDYKVTDIENSYLFDKTVRKNGEVVLYSHKFTETDAEWAGTQTFDSYGMTVTSRVYLERAYAVSDRTAKIVCKFNANSVACFEVVGNDGTSVNTKLTINVSNQTVQLAGKTAIGCDFLNATDEFMISLTKNYQDLRIKITDIYTGNELNIEYTMSGTGGAGDGAVETDKAVNVPMQQGYYALSADTGSFSVSKMIIVSSKCDVLIYGDSITEGEAYWPHDLFSNHWVQLLIRQMSGKALASGRSGGHFGDIYPRMQNEIPYIKPKYVMITTGTNGATSVQNYTTMVQYVKSQGCIPILNHIPCYDNDGDTTGFRAVNANIDTVRAAEEVTGVDFDLATSTAHDGQNVDTSTMWYEDYSSTSGKHYYHHPNVKGCAAMFQRILIDVPEIFDV